MLKGAGVREKLFFDIYVGALYLPQPSQDPGAILSGAGPAAVLMHVVYKKVSREQIIEAWEEGLASNHSPAAMHALRPQLAGFNALFATCARARSWSSSTSRGRPQRCASTASCAAGSKAMPSSVPCWLSARASIRSPAP